MIPYQYNFYEFLGNIGVILLVVTYFMNTAGKFPKPLYGLIGNLVAAILLLINLLVHPNISGIIIEIFWIGISVMGIYKLYKK